MKYGSYLLSFFAFFVVSYMLFCPERRSALGEGLYEELKPVSSNLSFVEPKWKKYNRIREVSDPNLGVILGDLESHLPNGHNYIDSNKLTWAHEASHGINAKIRNDLSTAEGYNGFYVLQDRYILIKEPEITIRDVAIAIPERLRGLTFDVYFEDQSLIWNDRPLYLIDEWISFTNGADSGKELNLSGWCYELLQAHNFNVYCIYLAMVTQRDCSDYRDSELKEFIKWNTERVFRLSFPSDRKLEEFPIESKFPKIASNWHICPHQIAPKYFANDLNHINDYIKLIKNAPEAEKLRKFAKIYFGDDWCARTYGF